MVEICDLFDKIGFIKKTFDPWSILKDHEIKFEKINFGFSRQSYKVSNLRKIEPETILFRDIPELKETQISNEKEHKNYEVLSKAGLAPLIYGRNDKYRIEEYIESNHIRAAEINSKFDRRKLALTLGKFHSIKITEDMMLNKEGFYINFLNLDIFMNKVRKNTNPENKENLAKKNWIFLKKAQEILTAEYCENLIKVLKKLNSEDFVYSNNDIWAGNILKETTGKKRIMIIDYEFCDLNFAGYDIGKIFLETMYDRELKAPYYDLIPQNFPNEEDQNDFLTFYLLGRSDQSLDSLDKIIYDDELLKQMLINVFNDEKTFNLKFNNIKKQTEFGFLFSGYRTFIQGLFILKDVDKEIFDFVKFAKDGYEITKKYEYLIDIN